MCCAVHTITPVCPWVYLSHFFSVQIRWRCFFCSPRLWKKKSGRCEYCRPCHACWAPCAMPPSPPALLPPAHLDCHEQKAEFSLLLLSCLLRRYCLTIALPHLESAESRRKRSPPTDIMLVPLLRWYSSSNYSSKHSRTGGRYCYTHINPPKGQERKKAVGKQPVSDFGIKRRQHSESYLHTFCKCIIDR